MGRGFVRPSWWRLAIALIVATLFITSCAKERPVKDIVANSTRIAKSDLAGEFVYQRTLLDVKFNSRNSDLLAPGIYLDADKLVRFRFNENSLDVVALDPLYLPDRPAETNNVLLSFPVRHVDVLRKQNADGEDTYEVEETESRRVWREREYVVIDLTGNRVDIFKEVKAASAPDGIAVDRTDQAINFTTQKQLADGTALSESYSFLRFLPSRNYEQRPYPKALQDRFGFFKTTTYRFDEHGRMTEAEKREYMNRWDSHRKIVYHFSPGFPAHLKPMVGRVFAQWNEAFRLAVGENLLEIRENTGQKLGDLRYSFIVYVDSNDDSGLLGYGPAVTNPRTGEILKADVFIYGGALKRSLYGERQWAKLLGAKLKRPSLDLQTPAPKPIPTLPAVGTFARSLQKLGGHAELALAEADGVRRDASHLVDKMRASARAEAAHCATRTSPDVMSAIAELAAEGDLSDAELEEQIFLPLLTHELGHNLGLRHNFMASADADHFHASGKSASAMDYGFLSSFEPLAPGPYDAAAIQVLYSNGQLTTDQAVKANFYYCTDENLFDSRYGLCEQFDTGKNLSEVALNLMKRYVASYNFNNLRLDKVHFGYDADQYVGRVMRYLIPLRLLFDHANAITKVGEGEEDEDKRLNLWLLLRQRVEAAPDLKEAVVIEVAEGKTIRLDPAKFAPAIADAQKAKQQVFAYLNLIINEDTRPEYDQTDAVFHELQTRGVLVDKLLAFLVVSLRTNDPQGDGAGISMYDSFHQPVAGLYTSLLSNTETTEVPLVGGTVTQLRLFDPNLRRFASEIIGEMTESASLEAGEIKELLKLERVTTRDLNQVQAYGNARTELRTLLFELESETDEVKQAEIQGSILEKRKAIEAMDFGVLAARDGISLKAHIQLPAFGVASAAGRLLNDNISLIEDRLWVIETLRAAAEADLAMTTEEAKKKSLKTKIESYKNLQLVFHRYVDTERSFAEALYRRYSPD